MKHQLKFIVGLFSLTILSCNSPTEAPQQIEIKKNSDRLEVYCFHGTRQCETCKNMKANTRETLEKYFSQELKDSTIVFAIIDVDNEANSSIAEKYEATGTALMINYFHNGKDSIVDWSDFAFEKANTYEEYLPELKLKIEEVIR